MTKKIIEILILIFIAASCERIADETDPAKLILGKWEIIEIGNWPIMEAVEDPGGYIKFLRDSILIEYASDTHDTMQKKYWINILLYECFYLQQEHRCVITGRYEYEFFDKNKKLRLDLSNIASNYTTFIYKRIK